MSDSNRIRIAAVRESTLGVTPGSPRMRQARITGEGLRYAPQFVTSDEIRADRMNVDPIKVNENVDGPINFELHYPTPDSVLSEAFRSALFNAWTETPSRDNDGVADSVITQVTASTGVIAVTTGPAFAARHLIRNSGYTASGNNGLFVITTGSATVPAVGAGLLTDEAAPPATARTKVVGLQGTSGDLVAVSDGITSSSLDFTTMGLQVGQAIKIGDASHADFQFGTAANNSYARVAGIAANKLTLDNLPTGWGADAGSGKTIRIFFGDVLKNGVTRSSMTIEKGFMDQAVPTYVVNRGCVVGNLELRMQTEDKITGAFGFMGLTGAVSTTSLDATPDAAPTGQIMASNVNIGRVSEAGVAVAGPNWPRSMTVQINNNLRKLTALGTVGAVDMGAGECVVNFTIETYYGSDGLLAKLLAGTPSSLMIPVAKNNQALVMIIPRAIYTDGAPVAGGKNQDVMLPLSGQAGLDTLTNSLIEFDRFEYVN